MIDETDRTLQKPSRRGLGWRIFFAGWTLLALWALWWLWHRAGMPFTTTSWFVGGLRPGAAPHQRLANWLKLADLSFHRIYPWLLLAPYVAWVAWRFPWVRRQWRTSLPAHVAGCTLFVISTHLVWVYADLYTNGRHLAQVTVDIRDSGQPKDFVAVPAPARVTNGLAKQPPEVLLSDGGPDRRQDRIIDERETRLEPRVYSEFPVRGRFVEDPFNFLSLFVYASLAGLVHTIQVQHRSRERERRTEALEAQLTAARLSALQAQLHPHFLFNALNAISTLLVRDARAARDALASFSELLRLALCQSAQAEVTLREDLEFLRRYVEIQQTRLGDRLGYEEAIPTEALDCLVPALLLQPLVENAIRHGIESSLTPGLVRVVVRPQGKRLEVTVEDNGAGLAGVQMGHGNGVGISLKNLGTRLETLYGSEQKLKFNLKPQGGAAVNVQIPLRRAPASQPAALVP